MLLSTDTVLLLFEVSMSEVFRFFMEIDHFIVFIKRSRFLEIFVSNSRLQRLLKGFLVFTNADTPKTYLTFGLNKGKRNFAADKDLFTALSRRYSRATGRLFL